MPDPNHFENSVLCVPYWPLMTKVGSRAASATPIRAVAARRAASALRTSGRCSSSADGTPAGTGIRAASSVSERPRAIAPGLRPTSTLSAFSCCATCRSKSATLAAGLATSASNCRTSSSEISP